MITNNIFSISSNYDFWDKNDRLFKKQRRDFDINKIFYNKINIIERKSKEIDLQNEHNSKYFPLNMEKNNPSELIKILFNDAILLKNKKTEIYSAYDSEDLPFRRMSQLTRSKVLALLSFVDLNIQFEGVTLLHLAVLMKDLELLKSLLERGIDPNIPNQEGETPLLLACLYGQKLLAEELLKYKADIHAKAKDGWTVLHYAACSGNLELVQFLLDKKANINCLTDRGCTAAMIASIKGYSHIAAILQKDLAPEQCAWLDHKLLNHRFGLSITVEHEKQTIKLFSFYIYFAYAALVRSTLSAMEKWLQEAPSNWTVSDTLAILSALEQAYYLYDKSRSNLQDKVDSALKAYKDERVVVIPISNQGHANTAILYKNFFIKGDRSNDSPGLEVYTMDTTTENLKDTVLDFLTNKTALADASIDQRLGLRLQIRSKHQEQHGGVCTWASSAKLAFQGAILAQLIKKGMSLDEAEKYSLNMYHAWVKQDRITAMEDYIKNVPESEVKKTVLACIYEHLVEKKSRKQVTDPVMTLIENGAREAIVLAAHVKHQQSPRSGIISSIE